MLLLGDKGFTQQRKQAFENHDNKHGSTCCNYIIEQGKQDVGLHHLSSSNLTNHVFQDQPTFSHAFLPSKR